MLAGAFDERIALSAPLAGGMALRFSGKEMGNGLGQGITEVVDQNTYWFGPDLKNSETKPKDSPVINTGFLRLQLPGSLSCAMPTAISMAGLMQPYKHF